MERSKLIKLDDIQVIPEVYPRTKSNWMIAYDYAQSMRSGSNFPPILVASFKGNLILVDGKHRMEATKVNKEKYISGIVRKYHSMKDIYVDAVKGNSQHGYQFSPYEKRNIIQKLKDFKLSMEDISTLTHIPLDKMESFVAHTFTNTLTGEKIILKSALKNMSGKNIKGSIEELQNALYSRTQDSMVFELLMIFKEGKAEIENLDNLEELQKLIGKYLKVAIHV